MASSNKTPHYNLSQFAPTDKPAWQGDYNSDMKKIDNGIYAAQNKADSLDASVSEATNKATQALEKAEAAEDAAENAAALAQEAKTTADNISGDLSGKVNKAGDTMTGPLVLPGDPTEDNQAATKKYVDEHGGEPSGDYLPLTGGTLTGPLTLSGDPTENLQAATKQYVDTTGVTTTKLAAQGIPTFSYLDASAVLVGDLLFIYAAFVLPSIPSSTIPLFKIALPKGYALQTPITNWHFTTSVGGDSVCSFTDKFEESTHYIYVTYTGVSMIANNQFSVFNIIQLTED